MITVIILAKNEEKRLGQLLPTLKWADRVLVIDDDSDDATVQVSKNHGAQVYSRSVNGKFAEQRNWALKKVRTKWVLFLDADERVSQELQEEILEITSTTNEFQGYRIKRIDTFLGKKLEHGETGHTYLVRLGVKGAGAWKRNVHEIWDIDSVGTLEHGIEHASHESATQLFGVVSSYADIEARSRYKQGSGWSLFELMVFPPAKFIKNYLWYKGFLDGRAGLVMAIAMSYHSFLVRFKLMQMYYPRDVADYLTKIFRILVWFLIATFGLGQLVRFELGSVTIYGFELLMIALVAVGTILLFKARKMIQPSFFGALGLFLGVLLLSLAVQYPRVDIAELMTAGLYWIRLLLYSSFFLILWQAVHMGWWRVNLMKLLMYVGFFWAVSGLIQYALIPDTRFLFWYGWDDHYFRLIGLLFDPGFLGLLLVLTLIIFEKRLTHRNWLFYCVVFVALLLTYSRSSYVVYLATLPLLGMYYKRWKSVAIRMSVFILLVFGMLFYVPVGGESVNLRRTYSVTSRAESVLSAYDIYLENKIFGIGFNRYPSVFDSVDAQLMEYHPSAPDNSFMFVLATSGLIGLASLLLLLGQIVFEFRTSGVVVVSIVAVLLHSLTNNSLFYVFVMLWMILLLNGKIQEKQKLTSLQKMKQ